MQTRACSPESFPIVYCISWPLYRGTSLLWIMGTVVTPNGQNQYKFTSESRQSRLTGVKVWKIFAVLKILAISITFQGLYALKGCSTISITWHTVTGNDRHFTGCTLCIKDTSLLQTLQCGPVVSIIQKFQCIHVLILYMGVTWTPGLHIGIYIEGGEHRDFPPLRLISLAP